MHRKSLLALLVLVLVAAGISAQDDDMSDGMTTTFTVTIENVAGIPHYDNLGESAVPVDAEEAGPAVPGSGYEFSFTAVPGDTLSFVTMLAQSNDLFFAPDEVGIALFDDMDAPISGDVTDQVLLWDAGTEVNQPIGEGDQQAPRQAGPNTGDAESNPIEAVDEPATAEIITVTLTGSDSGEFTVRIDNVSGDAAVPSPITPVLWVVRNPDGGMMGDDMSMDDSSMDDDMMMMDTVHGVFFNPGEKDRGNGLEAIAEDGDTSKLFTVLAGSELTTSLTSVIWAVHEDTMGVGVFFTDGEADRGEGLEAVAEDGDATALAAAVEASMVSATGVAAIPDGADSADKLFPGNSYSFTFEAAPGQFLSFVSMFVESNDLFFAPKADGIALFDDMGTPVHGQVTKYVKLWDAGTEVNEEPGVGENQAPRQAGPNTGEDENGVVRKADGGYPPVPAIIRVTITPADDMMEMGG